MLKGAIMGLTIHYSLAAESLSASSARAAVEQLKQRALDLPFSEVGEIVEVQDDACRRVPGDEDDEYGWLMT